MRHSFLYAAAALAMALTLGCSFDLGEDSAGEMGNLRFEYSSGSCIAGCSLDRSALEGALVTVVARDEGGARRLSARLADDAHGAIAEQSEGCSCTSSDSSSITVRGVAPTEACHQGERRSCSLSVDVEASRAGDTKLEIFDGDGRLVDRIGMKIRAASRIDVAALADDVEVERDGDGVFPVKRGAAVELESKVLDADGREMVFTRRGVAHEYGDRTVLQPDAKRIFGRTDVEYMVTGRAGETSVTVRATGAEAVARFRVLD